MKIITVSREFGSGGRELGRRIADELNIDYYDHEILTAISKSQGSEDEYVRSFLNNHGWSSVPLTFQHSFFTVPAMQDAQLKILVEQRKILEAIARSEKDCVIVGRNADVILQDEHPFTIFVCAEKNAKIKRCLERADPEENLPPKEIERNMRRIDKSRAFSRSLICDAKWGDRQSYHLTVNTTQWDIKALAPIVASFAENWFSHRSDCDRA